MAKVVYNACYGGFSLSDVGVRRYAGIKGLPLYPERDRFGGTTYWTVPAAERQPVLDGDAFYQASFEERQASNNYYAANTVSDRDIDRTDPALVQVVEELGEAANGTCASLRIEDVPPGTLWRIDEYDGNESVMTVDSYEWKVAI